MKKREAAIVSAYTGILIGSFEDLHKYAEEILGGSITALSFSIPETVAEIKRCSFSDFKALSDNLKD